MVAPSRAGSLISARPFPWRTPGRQEVAGTDRPLRGVAERGLRACLLAVALSGPASGAGPIPLRPEQASARTPTEFAPVHAGKLVSVKGLVSSRAIAFPDYQHLAIEEGGYGLVLEGTNGIFD